jgi:hypothetical protein
VKSIFGMEQLPSDWTGAQSEVDVSTITALSLAISSKWTSD